ncbi:MAG: transcription antitermination factor NusB [Anaerolineae bacterium]|nr:MAG: transcription antitermination factor NusB [Anaerolineae bacterium]
MKQRTQARSLALQALYEYDLSGHPVGEALQHRLEEHRLGDKYAAFALQIVQGVHQWREKLDFFIAQYAPEWPLEQVAPIDRNLLRIALWEMVIHDDTPTKVAINEAVELAKHFGSDSTPRFVNGVLGTLTEHLSEIKQQLGR